MSRASFYRNNVGVPLLMALLVFLFFDITELDRTFSNLFYDPVAGVFPLEHNHLFEKITHKWARIIPNWTGELAIIGSLLSLVWPLLARRPGSAANRLLEACRVAAVLRFTARHRRDFFYVVLAFALSTTVIHYLKSHTSVYCPVETTLYGGQQIRHEWFENFTLWNKAGAGRCWPGGHASSAFSLFALYFVARRYAWRHSRVLLWGITLLGFVYGTTRVLQGWHYMSHTLWAGIFVWFSSLLMALAFYGWQRLQQPLGERGRAVCATAEQQRVPG
jgi:membrane-associated PAP2 superfamily phosphatase